MTVRPVPRRGVYADPFWIFVGQRRLHLQRCTACGHFWYPPGPGCPRCLSGDYEWVPVAGTGRVVSWAVFRRQYFDSLPPPYTIVAAALAEGPILIADLAGGSGASLAIDQSVELCYDEAETPGGETFTIYHWRAAAREPLRSGRDEE